MTFNDKKCNVTKKEEQYVSFIVTFLRLTSSSNYLPRLCHGTPMIDFQFSHGIGDHGLQKSIWACLL